MIVMSKMHLIATIVIGWSCGVDFMDARVGLRFALDLAQVWNKSAKQSGCWHTHAQHILT